MERQFKIALDNPLAHLVLYYEMLFYTTFDAAKKLGIPYTTLATYLANGKVPSPSAEIGGKTRTQIWTEEEIEYVRQLLPKIANGRKTRYKKQSTKVKPRKSKKK